MELVSDKGDELTIGRLAFCIADRVPKEALEGVQVASVPSYLNGVANGSFYTGRRGLEGLCHLGVEDFRDGVSLAYGQQKGSEWGILF